MMKNKESIERVESVSTQEWLKLIEHLNEKEFANEDGLGEIREQGIYIDIPTNFSMYKNTENTIIFIKKLYGTLMRDDIKNVRFNYSNCKNLEFSASVIMDIIILAVNAYKSIQGINIRYVGNVPQKKKSKEILLASGLPHHLRAKSKIKANKERIRCFELVRGKHDANGKFGAKVATDLTVYFDECFRTQGMYLNFDGKIYLSRLLGEVLDNCEIHGGENATWYTQGHYYIYTSKEIGEMQLLFLSFGETIYEGLKKDVSEETKNRLEHMMKQQSHIQTEVWNEETIYTVLALQDGISRLRDKNVKGCEYRGTGTVSLIEQFYKIGKTKGTEKPDMTIVSGHTFIKFDDRYKMKVEKFEDDPIFGNTVNRIIAFNEKNDIYKPADSRNVQYLREFFPGTVISLKFYIDRKYIECRKKGVH